MGSPAKICEQWGRNLSFGSADVSGAGTRDEPLRKSAWEAGYYRFYMARIQHNSITTWFQTSNFTQSDYIAGA